MKGMVRLVGAGPGDPDLLTIKGRQAIQQADVVVYDRLVSQEIMALIPEGVPTINVGKISSNHLVPQEEINQILLEEALAGKRVVRLKGGDPFLFGRGGEELELLHAHGVPFEVVPGIPSAIGAATYGGIPVTHRDCASSLHIITGHPKAGKALDIPFQSLVEVGGTYVFLMGVSTLPQLCQGLLQGGACGTMPAAIIERGTTPQQRRVSGTLETLPQLAKEANITSPALIIVGDVCAMAEDFDWFSKRPLMGQTIVVTRPKERQGTLSGGLRALGAHVVEYPCIQTVPMVPCPAMVQAFEQLHQYQWLVFTSPAGVSCGWNQLQGMGLDARALGHLKLAVIGEGTNRALKEHGLQGDFVPEIYDTYHLGKGLAQRATGKVLILRAEEGSPELTRLLEGAHISFDDVAVYTTQYQNPISTAMTKLLAKEPLWVTFTSASTVKGFVSSLGEGAELSHVIGLCIGVQTQTEAKKYGIKTVVSHQATIESMTQLATELAQSQQEE